ncbi:uncharacterized protein F4822DRAFT_124578 [Hypoxylon trugodes]|uniref:uncharacterized protein n=1 Tax=Hypoxylon trugodes TaxID=326681 RepID=UPI002192D247|nr:uncharacterized protein F4822DRAFT_124578 [Hypoxylon trugodes]KAI1392310.1 hypothetical protein F4822DRAFT_124578 [Hypoxylon trugodes]
MAPSSKPFIYCEGAPSWDPATYVADTALHERVEAFLAADDLQSAIIASFGLPTPPRRDPYVYHAIVSVTLPEVQHVVSLGRQNGLHDWYFAPASAKNDEDAPTQPKSSLTALPPPTRPDIDAYLSIFDPNTSTPAALKTFLSNAKKGSLRAEIATYLLSKRYLHPTLEAELTIPKRAAKKKKKSQNKNTADADNTTPPTNNTGPSSNNIPFNPYLPYLAFSARVLEWAGPSPSSSLAGTKSHHILPILMHHFGCACPTHEALSILRILARGRGVLDMGSGGGYWSYMLRAYGIDPVIPVDSAQSAWRVTWVKHTVIAEGGAWLRKRRKQNRNITSGGGNSAIDPNEPVLLLVYPVVGGSVAGGAEGGFTKTMMDAYCGDTLAVVGTQNRNGYTGFRGLSMDKYVERERSHEGWVKVVQVALPSFPGKDEALFVFQRGARAPSKDTGAGGEVDDNKDGSNRKNRDDT